MVTTPGAVHFRFFWFNRLMTLVLVAFTAFIVWASSREPELNIVVPIVMLTIAVIFAVGVHRSFVRADGDVLVVRNGFRTHRLHRDQIDDFERAKLRFARFSNVGYIDARTHSGQILRLRASAAGYSTIRIRQDRQLNDLRHWKRGPTGR